MLKLKDVLKIYLKYKYCFIFQSVVCPNGLIANLYGPIAGHHHDAFMLHESNLMPRLEGKFRAPHIFSLLLILLLNNSWAGVSIAPL